MDELAHFAVAILRVGTFTRRFWGVHGSNFAKLGKSIGRSSLFQSSDILLHFQTQAAQS